MSSLRFTEPLNLKGLPAEAAEEWVDLEVNITSADALKVGSLGQEEARMWDDVTKGYRCDGPFPHDPDSFLNEINDDEFYWISFGSLYNACKNSKPPRHLIRDWLLKEGGEFMLFRVQKEVAEYNP